MDNKHVIDMLSDINGAEFSEEQLNILNYKGGMCIVACAGSGKTSTLTNLIVKRILSGEIDNPKRLLCTTYSRAGALEMEERINRLLKKVGLDVKITVKTLHAFYLHVLKTFGFDMGVISNTQRLNFILKACKENKVVLKDEELIVLDSLLSYQVNNLLSDDKLVKSYVYTLENIDKDTYTKIRLSYNKEKVENNLIDFDDMQLYMYSFLVKKKREDILNYCRSRWNYFYIDEAQDISKIQFEILRKLVTDPNKLVFIGDDDQCIYQWRGADPSIILNICGYYDIDKLVLSTNYRCKSEILDLASTGIKYNIKRYKKEMIPKNLGGEVRICNTNGGNLYNQSKYAYKYIKGLIDSGVSPNKIAVLSRNNNHLTILSNMLYLDGIYTNSAEDMRFTCNSIYKDIRSILRLLIEECNGKLTESILWKVCKFLGARGSRYIGKIQNLSGSKLVDILGDILNNYMYGSDSLNIDKFSGYGRYINNSAIQYLEVLYNILKINDEYEKALGLLSLYLDSMSFIYKTRDRQRIVKGYTEYILDLIRGIGLDATMNVLRSSEQFDSSGLLIDNEVVTMSTIHGAKGREWEYVILFLDDNIAFPSFEGIKNMVDKGISIGDIYSSIDEDRRLHYVAMTRAKENLMIFADYKNLSVYLLECLGLIDSTNSNKYILDCALNENLSLDVVKKVGDKLKDDSKYYINIDVSNVDLGNTVVNYPTTKVVGLIDLC